MPRFNFQTDNIEDAVDAQLESVDAAKCEALKLAGRILGGEVAGFWNNGGWTMTVSDDRGLILFQLCIIGTEAPTSLRASRSTFASPPA
jgi:hypothetical protein